MNNNQLTGARRAMGKFPTLKVTIGKTADGDTLTPYLKDDVFTRGETVTVTDSMSAEDVESRLRISCVVLLNE